MKLLEPYYKENNIGIVFSADCNYAPYLATCLKSLIINANKKYNYDITVLDGGIRESDKKIIQKFIENQNNFHIKYFDINEFIEENREKLYLSCHASFANYYRIFAPKIFSHKRLLYLDCDTIINGDISELFFQNIGENSFGVINHLYDENIKDDFFEYKSKILKLKNPNFYFNSGVLVMNNKKLQDINATQQCLDLLSKIKPLYWDQCLLNLLFQDDIKFLDYRFNLQYHYFSNYKPVLKIPSCMTKEIENAIKNPVVVHFTGSCKPWQGNSANFSEYFWKYAKQTPYYKKLMHNLRKNEFRKLNFFEKIFSVTKSNDKTSKQICILNLRFYVDTKKITP